ncbi:MAG TPA: class I SAM-dependent methyltransferase [Rhodanobacteraceae bacterium]|jgi:SAM-dependent methyltransferase|nr:class I SAM-dependent methyltransferase [Rhodanobacteraceae bacterium]
MDDRMQQYDINARVYHRPGVERQYRNLTLMQAEAIALLRHQPAFAGKDILDIGVGTGRTSIYLAPLARRYQATDYSPVMVRHMQRTMPEIQVLQADMRHMPQLADASFDFVLASNCVFDASGHEDRIETLREIHRLLRPDGLLVFSTHNRNWVHALRGPRLRRSRNPVTQALMGLHWMRSVVHHRRLRNLQAFTDEYAILNDGAHDFALMHYNIDPDRQRQQLAGQGFDTLEVLDEHGHTRLPGDPAPDCAWLLYVARRQGKPADTLH